MAGPWDAPPTEEELAQAPGDPWAAPPTEAELAASKNDIHPVLSAVGGGVQGASFGTIDELDAAKNAGFLTLLRSAAEPSRLLSPGEVLKQAVADYRTRRDTNRKLAEDLRTANPEEYVGGELVGAVLSPVPGGAAAKGAGFLARLGKGAAQGAGVGALYGAGASEADLTKGEVGQFALDTGLGTAFGGAGGALGHAVGEGVGKARSVLAERSARKLEAAEKGLDDLAQAKVLKDLASASGSLGDATQQGNRLVENLMRMEAAGALTAEQKATLDALKASGAWERLQQKLAGRNLEDLPGKVAEIESRESVLAGMQAGREELFDAARQHLANPMAQLVPRVKRYAAPVATTLLGSSAGGLAGLLAGGSPAEIGGAALFGAGIRPAIHATRRMLQHPATQRAVHSGLLKATQEATEPARYAKPAAVGATEAELTYVQALLDALRGRRLSDVAGGADDENTKRKNKENP